MFYTRRWGLSIALCAALIGALYPIGYLAAPDWRVRVVDRQGQPLEGITVRLAYQNYSVEAEGHELSRATDTRGFAEFAARKESASVLSRIFYTSYAAMAFVHASFGPHANVFAFGRGYQGFASREGVIEDWTGSPAALESVIVVERQDETP